MGFKVSRNGFTATCQFRGQGVIPPLQYEVKLADPEKVYDYRLAVRQAATGSDHRKAVLGLLAPHVVRWQVMGEDDSVLPIDQATLAMLPAPVLDNMVEEVCGFGVDRWEGLVKN